MIADLILRAIDTHAQWPRPRSQNAKRQGGSALAARRQLLINLGSRRTRRASLMITARCPQHTSKLMMMIRVFSEVGEIT